MMKDVSLDVAALVLLVILVFSCIFRKMTSGVSNRIYLVILFSAIVATVFDIIAVTLDNADSRNDFALYAAHSGYLIAHYLIAPLHLFFVISLTDIWHKLRRNTILQMLIFLPSFIVMIAFILNINNNMLFSVKYGYERGTWFPMLYAAAILYVIYDIIYIIRYNKMFDFDDIASITAVLPIYMVAMVVQAFFPNVLVEMFGIAAGLLIISIGVQRPEDYIDSFTQLMKHSAYAHDMKRSYYNGKHVNIIMLNIANFQSIQAMIGFDLAMHILKEVADKIRQINTEWSAGAGLYYLDNGRFRLVFDWNEYSKAEDVANVLNRELKNASFNGLDISLEPFIVLARCPEEISEFKMLMSFGADFHKKNYYTGQVIKANEIFNQNQLDIRNNIDTIIEDALANERFQVYYQPIYSLSKDKFVSAEALIRLIDPKHGYISPEALITAAEQNGAIHKIGELVFEKVCQFIASDDFERLGLEYIEVNLSVAQIMNSDLPDKLFAVMKKYDIAPNKINLEITETAAAYAQRVMTENLEKLTKAGISFSLDDYGTGYSNMKRVIQLPLKIIKLDKSFVDENNNPKMWIFLENTVKMLKDMNMEIVVEGVETREMLNAFSDLKCDFIQGYFFSKPIPETDFVEFISKQNNKAS